MQVEHQAYENNQDFLIAQDYVQEFCQSQYQHQPKYFRLQCDVQVQFFILNL